MREAGRFARQASSRHPLATLLGRHERHLPIVTVHDAASHALAWLGSVFGARVVPVGVDDFGQSGSIVAARQASSRHPLATLLGRHERHLPIVTVHDAASHALAWLGSVFGARVVPVGVDDFGQSGSIVDLYRHFDLLPEQLVNAALVAVTGWPVDLDEFIDAAAGRSSVSP